MSRKPTLGYPSRTDAVLALRGQKLSTEAIAKRIGIKPKTVVALELSAGRMRQRVAECRTVLFPVELLGQLGPHAARRGVSANELARRIVETVVDDHMIDAVLDDSAEVAVYLKGAA